MQHEHAMHAAYLSFGGRRVFRWTAYLENEFVERSRKRKACVLDEKDLMMEECMLLRVWTPDLVAVCNDRVRRHDMGPV